MFNRPLIALDVVVTEESSISVVANVCDVETWTLYDVAPDTALQLRVELTWMPVAASVGDVSVGTAGAATIVVKVCVAENALVPPAFLAFTLQ